MTHFLEHAVLLVVSVRVILGGVTDMSEDSKILRDMGHYPPWYCQITSVMLNTTDGIFYYQRSEPKHDICTQVGDVWDLMAVPQILPEACDDVYDKAHIFTIFYYYGSNYFHLHYDMMIPLYAAVHHELSHDTDEKQVFMPTVEISRLKNTDWNTSAFKDENKYWVLMAKFLAGSHTFLPIDEKLQQTKKNICFLEANFGTPQVNFSDSQLIKSYIQFVKRNMDINESTPPPRVGIISRSNRRRILNEEELVKASQEIVETDLLKFEGMSFKQQVELMQKYTVMVGVNGAGLMNAIYLPTHGVAVQLVPYKAHVNWKEFGRLLTARGPYLEWHNTHEELHRPTPRDEYNNRPDTIVHIDEFKNLIREALEKSANALRAQKEEL